METFMTFLEVVSQFCCILVLSIVFLKIYTQFARTSTNHYQLGNMALALLFLITGKVGTLFCCPNIFAYRAYVNTSIGFFFLIMAITLTRFMVIERRYQIWVQLAILPFTIEFVMPGARHGEFVTLAYLYLVLITFSSKIRRKCPLLASFLVMATLNLLMASRVINRPVFLWGELLGFILFGFGLYALCEDYMCQEDVLIVDSD